MSDSASDEFYYANEDDTLKARERYPFDPRQVELSIQAVAFLYGCKKTYTALADFLGVSRAQPGRWMRGETVPQLQFRQALAFLSKYQEKLNIGKKTMRDRMRDMGFPYPGYTPVKFRFEGRGPM